MISIATRSSSSEYHDFIANNGLHELTHLYADEDAALVNQLHAEFKVDGSPTFVWIRADGEYQSSAGFSEYWFDREARWVED